jgi:hypothetical protein
MPFKFKTNEEKLAELDPREAHVVDRGNGAEVYGVLSAMANVMANGTQTAEFLEAFERDHPTLQQQVVGLALDLVLRHSKRPYYDDRNKDSGKIAKKVADLLNEDEEIYLRDDHVLLSYL